MSKEKIIAVVIDTALLTLYRPDGSTIEIPQGDARVRSIIDQVIPIIDRGGTAEIYLTIPNSYEDFEKKTNGFVRFFKVAKKAVAHIFGADDAETETVMPGKFGNLPGTNTQKAVDEIIANAKPTSSKDFHQPTTGDTDTVVAVVNTPQGKRIVPDVEKLHDQVKYGAAKGSTIGLQRLLERLGAVIDKRGHSVQDVIRFLERADLPIADDGSIIAYKALNRVYSTPGTYVDCHTGKVTQRVGSYVCVDEQLVDRNRRNECSNGLHIARRAYLGGFTGNVCVLVKIAPEDVVTVPHGDANKVRVCGYHILFELSDDAFKKLKNNSPMTDNSAAANLVSLAIAGKHPAPSEQVKIHGQCGADVRISKMVGGKPVQTEKPVVQHTALDDPKNAPQRVNPSEVNKEIVKVGTNRKEKIRLLMNTVRSGKIEEAKKAAIEITDLKKAAKVGWDTLGVTDRDQELITKSINTSTIQPTKTPAQKKPKDQPTADPVVSSQATADKIIARSQGSSGRLQTAQGLWTSIMQDNSLSGCVAHAKELVSIKKAAKVSWEKLGINDDQAKTIQALISDGTPPEGSVLASPQAKITEQPKGGSSVQRQARQLYEGRNFLSLKQLKKEKKKSWAALGFTEFEAKNIELQS
jgi:hypothetical protein